MSIMERCTQEITPEGWKVVGELELTFDAAEEKMGGVPKKRRYLLMYGGLAQGTMVWEREWEGMAAIDAYAAKAATDPDFQAALRRSTGVFVNGRFDLLVPFEDWVKM
jgi:hypothetical protein